MPELRLGPGDAGRTVEVAAGDRLVVALPEIAGTGYTWTVVDLPPGSTVLEESYVPPAAGGIGGASEHVFVLAPPTAAGTLRLRSARAWAGAGGADVQHYVVTLAWVG